MRARRPGTTPLAATALLILSWGAGRADADLMLTQGAADSGFQLSTFASGFPNNGHVGPVGIAFPSEGGVLVSDILGNVRLFPTLSDGQQAGAVPVAHNYGARNADGFAQVGNSIYMAQAAKGAVVQVNPNGSFNRYVVGGIPNATGIITDPANGHLFVSTTADRSGGPIFEVDPIAKTSSLFLNVKLDGLAVSPDGKTLYGATDESVVGYNIATRSLVFDSGPIAGGTDGIALGMGNLLGNLFVNTNGGTVVEVNLATGLQTLIATDGSRGDFVTVAPDGSLLLTQTDTVARLTAPPGGGFAISPRSSDPPSLPEPSTLALVALGALGGIGLAGWRRWRGRPHPRMRSQRAL